MPTYEYRCEAGHESEARQSIEAEPLRHCPRRDCDAPAERLISPGGGVLSDGDSGGGADEGCGPSGFT